MTRMRTWYMDEWEPPDSNLDYLKSYHSYEAEAETSKAYHSVFYLAAALDGPRINIPRSHPLPHICIFGALPAHSAGATEAAAYYGISLLALRPKTGFVF